MTSIRSIVLALTLVISGCVPVYRHHGYVPPPEDLAQVVVGQTTEADLETLDTSALRIARQQLHQACGALEMVGISGPAQVLRGMEAAVNRFVQRPEYCTQEAATTLERTHFALMEYLEAVLAGKSVSAVALFPQYRDTQALAGNDKVHPADLWPSERRAREPRGACRAGRRTADSSRDAPW